MSKQRAPKTTEEQKQMFLDSIPDDRYVSTHVLIENMKPMGLNAQPVRKMLRDFVRDKKVVRIVRMPNANKKLYRRVGVFS